MDTAALSYFEPVYVSVDLRGNAQRKSLILALPAIFLLLGGAAVLLPYLFVPVIPGNDYPNHLARLAILGAAPGSALRAGFAPHWALMPDLGLDLAYMALNGIASPEAVLRLCLVGSFAVMLGCVWAIQRTLFGRAGFAVAAAPLLVTGLPAVMGYVSFIMSCALLMVGVWLYLKWRDRLDAARVAALAGVGALVWLCHIAGFGVLIAFIGASHLWPDLCARRWPGLVRRGMVVAAIAAPGFVLSLLAEEGVGGAASWVPSLLPRTLLAPVVATGQSLDVVLWLGVLGLAVIVWRRGDWRVGAPAKAGLCLLGVLIAFLPWSVGTAVDIGSRIVVPTVLILLATSSIRPPRGALAGAILLGCLSGLIGFRSISFGQNAAHEGRTVAAFRSAIAAMPQGATLMVGRDRWRRADCSRAGTPYAPLDAQSHLAAYATIDRGAWEPFIFAGKGMQPVRSVKPFASGALPTMVPPTLELLAQPGAHTDDGATVPAGWPQHYDYLLVLGHGCHANPMPALLEPDSDGPGFTLFKLRKPVG